MSQIAFKAIRIQKASMASFIEVFNFRSHNINCYKSGHKFNHKGEKNSKENSKISDRFPMIKPVSGRE